MAVKRTQDDEQGNSPTQFMAITSVSGNAKGWTFDTMHDYFVRYSESNDKRYNDLITSQGIALEKAEIATEKRFASVNEFRAVLSDQQKTFLSRNEHIIEHKGLDSKIDTIMERLAMAEGTGAGKHAFWGYIVGGLGVISLVVSMISMFLHYK